MHITPTGIAQAYSKLLTAILWGSASKEDAKALCYDDSLSQLDLAKALYFSAKSERDSMCVWLFKRLDAPIADMEDLMKGHLENADFSYALPFHFWKRCPSEALLKASIDKGLRWPREDDLFRFLFEAGSVPLVLYALDAGYRFDELPELKNLRMNLETASFTDGALIRCLADRGLKAPHAGKLAMFYALHTADLQLLRFSCELFSGADDKLSFLYVLTRAGRAGWVEGLRKLVQQIQPSNPPHYRVLEAAMEGGSLACLDVLLGLGREWELGAFHVAFREGHPNALDHEVERGCLGPLGSPLPCLTFDGFCWSDLCKDVWVLAAPPAWLADLRQVVQGGQNTKVVPKLHCRSTLGARLTAYVAALMDAETAQLLASEIRGLKLPAYFLLKWWARESRALAQRHTAGASTALPHVLTSIMRQAGFAAPEDLQRAESLALKLCEWMQIAVP